MMARHIDADELHKIIENGVGTPALKLFANCCVELAPTADVVPRAEVNKIFHQIFEIIKNYEFDSLAAKEKYGIFQIRYLGCDIMKLREKYGITDNVRKE